MREQVARLGKLATDLLDLSKLEAGSLELRPEATDLGDLSRRITSEFAPALAKHDSELELRLAADDGDLSRPLRCRWPVMAARKPTSTVS